MNGDQSYCEENDPANKNNDTFCKFQESLHESIKSIKQNSSAEREYEK